MILHEKRSTCEHYIPLSAIEIDDVKATGAAVVAAAKSMTSKSMIRNVPNTIFGTPFDMFIGDNKDALDNPVPQ